MIVQHHVLVGSEESSQLHKNRAPVVVAFVLNCNTIKVFVEPSPIIHLQAVAHVNGKLVQGFGSVKCSREENNGDLVVAAELLPFGEQFREKSIDRLLEVQVAVNVKVPHFRAHLDEQIDHAGVGAEDDLCFVVDDATGNSLAHRPHFVDCKPDKLASNIVTHVRPRLTLTAN